MAETNNDSLRREVVQLLKGGSAHADFKKAVAGVPADARGKRVPHIPHSLWELLEHLRIAQWDILEFTRDPKHQSPEFPAGYWPEGPEPPSGSAWDQTVKSFERDRDGLIHLAETAPDLQARIPHGDGQTILRELLLAADHNSYHLGQFVLLRRLLGVWNE